MNPFIVATEIIRGKDLYRIFMNAECSNHSISGITLDVGSGRKLASYYRFLKKNGEGIKLERLDLGFDSKDMGKIINLEKDALPFSPDETDTLLLFNVLEHLYNYRHVLTEIKRVLKPGGKLVGAVPFLVPFHPDPHDYWRYTVESLEKIFSEQGFVQIKIRSFGYGPAVAAFAQIEGVIPRIVKLVVLPFVFLFDWLITSFRPKLGKNKFCLGVFFSVSK